jgi:MATE family multidrug resistance protein
VYSIRSEVRTLLALALPIMGTQLAQTGMGFVDAVMAGSISDKDLAAVGVAFNLFHPITLLLLGVLFAFTPIVAHIYGARRLSDIPEAVQSTFFVALLLGLLGFLAVRQIHPILGYMNVEPELIPMVKEYLNGISWGIPALMLYQVMRSLNEGVGHTAPIFIIAVLGLLANIPANYMFMHGLFGFPAMGGAGCGWASALVMWICFIAITLQVMRSKRHQEYRIFSHIYRPNPKRIRELTQLGVPMGLSIFAEVSLFSIISLFVARLGTVAVAGNHVTLNFTSLVFMIPMSLSLAITVRVGQLLGAERFEHAKHAAWTGIGISLVIASISSTLMMNLAESIAALYTQDHAVVKLASHLILFAAFFQLSDALQVSATGALRGYKDTRGPLLITLISFWGIGIPLGYHLGLTDKLMTEPMGPQGFWVGLIVGLSLAALLLLIRLISIMKRQSNTQTQSIG